MRGWLRRGWSSATRSRVRRLVVVAGAGVLVLVLMLAAEVRAHVDGISARCGTGWGLDVQRLEQPSPLWLSSCERKLDERREGSALLAVSVAGGAAAWLERRARRAVKPAGPGHN